MTYQNRDSKIPLAYLSDLFNYSFDDSRARELNRIMIFLKGDGMHTINSANYRIQSNSIHLLARHDVHSLECSSHSRGLMIIYREQFLHNLQITSPQLDFGHVFRNSKIIHLNVTERKGFKFICQELLRKDSQSAYMHQLIGALFTKIATLNNDAAEGSTYDPIVAAALELMELNYKSRLTIKEYAAMMHITPRTLQNRFKKACNTCFSTQVQQRLLTEAKKLLCISCMNVGEIAEELGFKETAHFSNWFKKKTTYFPLQYKCGYRCNKRVP